MQKKKPVEFDLHVCVNVTETEIETDCDYD